jgi:ribonucleoside-diphosphate reductase beta chain
MTVFQGNKHTQTRLFFGEQLGIARYDKQAFPFLEKLTEKQLSFFWLPTEVDVTRDGKDFKELAEHEKHIFTSNLKRQILLDSVQGRGPSLAFLPIASTPELENWIQTWAFFETIHSRSYTHIIRNVYPDPSEVFDGITDIPEIINCAVDISKDYDHLIHKINDRFLPTNLYAAGSNLFLKKEALWRCLMAVNALEGIRFYASFACSWAFAETKRMEGNAKIIKFIARDENLHLAATQQILKTLVKTDKQFAEIAEALKDDMRNMYIEVAQQEKDWARYIFAGGTIIGLNLDLLSWYIDFIASKRMTHVGLAPLDNAPKSNPLPWTQKWISGSEVQVAPQETEITSYVTGGMSKDITDDSFKGLSL